MKLFKNHKWAILFALLAAVIVAYPQVYLRYDLGDSYRGIEVIGASDDEQNWLPRIREAQDGHPSFSSVYYKDGKDDPYLFQPLGTIMVASLGSLFSLDINNTVLLSRLFFSFIVFLIIYAFVYLFSKEKLIALTATVALTLGRDIFSRGGIQELITIGSPSFKYLNLMRPVNPLMTYFFFFGFLLFFWLFYTRKQWRWGILSALMLGLSFYDYFYTWTFLYVFCGILCFIFLFQKRWHDVKRIALILFIALLIAIPYFINLYQITIHPNYAALGQRYGLVEGRSLTIGFLIPLLLVIFLLFFPREKRNQFFFGLALVITPFIVYNQQLITNKALANVHYHWYFNWPLAIVLSLTAFLLWLSQRKQQFFKKALAVFIIIFSLSSGILVQSGSYAAKEQKILERQRFGPVMDWLNENSRKEEVVLSNDEVARLVVIYTPLNVLYHSSASKALAASEDRLLESLFLLYRLDGVGQADVEKVFLKDRADISNYLYGMHYYFITGDESGIPDEIIFNLSKKYQRTLDITTDDFFNILLRRYEVKYVVWDKTKNLSWQLDQYQFLEKAAEIGDFTIYKYEPR